MSTLTGLATDIKDDRVERHVMSRRTYAIYQTNAEYRFMRWNYAGGIDEKTGKRRFNWKDYKEVAGGVIHKEHASVMEVLSDLLYKYNMDIPLGYQGRSLSTSDIVCLREGSKEMYFYMDGVACVDITDEVLNP